MGWPTTTISKTLLAASSTAIGSISTAAGGTVSLTSATLDTGRRISVFSASLSGPTYTITGLTSWGAPIQEVITPSTTVVSVATTTQDFYRVTSVLLSCAITNSSGGFVIGTSSQGGTPWQVVDVTKNPMNLGFQLIPTSSLTQTSFETTMDSPYYDFRSNSWLGAAFPTRGPQGVISSLGSSVIGPSATIGSVSTPIVAWRITFSSSGSSGTGGTAASVTQLGV